MAIVIDHPNAKTVHTTLDVQGMACCRFSGHHPKLTQPFFQTQLG
jgi:hypothetical protein